MKREGLTITMIFWQKVQIMGKGLETFLLSKKMTRGNHEQYSYISRQAMRYNIVQQSNWDTTPVDGKAELFSLRHLQLLKITPKLICLDT